MKHYNIFFAILFCLSFGSCSKTTVINNPEIMATNTRSIEISRIELSDTATVFFIDAYNAPGRWIRIDSETFLEGNVTDKQYKLIRSEGFELDTQVDMPETGTMSFKLYFEPLDKNETAVEFVEGYGSGAFILSGIQLKEQKEKKPTGKIKCHISGVVIDRPQSQRLILQPWNSDPRVYLWISVPIRDGKFDYTFYVDTGEVYELIFYDEERQGAMRPIYFFAEAGNIEFILHPMDRWQDNIISTKTPLNLSMKDYNEKLMAMFDFTTLEAERNKLIEEDLYYSDEFKKWREDINKATPEERDKLYRLQTELQSSGRMYSEEGKAMNERAEKFSAERSAWIFDYIKNNPSLPAYYELVSIVRRVLSSMQYDPANAPDPTSYFAVYEEIYKTKYPDHPYTDKMEMFISGNSLKVGGKYIDFTAPDANGKEFKLSEQIAGKVALIDLWASWCGPCRRTSMSMIPVYEQYKDKGFTIVGVAREKNVADMVRAAERDGYPWLTLVELEDHGKIWNKYGIGNAGGGTFLVDKTGTILAVHPTAEEVIAILESYL